MSDAIEGAQDSYRELCGDYRAGYAPLRLEFLRKRTFESHGAFLLPYLQPHHRVLDCGCGPGTISVGLARYVPLGSLTCIDFSEHQLEEARLCASQAGLGNIHFFRQDVHALDLESATFDVVFANALIEHLREQATALLEMWRVLRPGGVLALRSPDWTALRLSPATDAGDECVELFASRLKSCRALEGGEELSLLFQRFRPRVVRQSTYTEAHRPACLFADVIVESLSDHAGEYPNPSGSTLDRFRAWSRDPFSAAVEKWDELILIKDTWQ